jgi:trimeric autotransporter adhesin
MKLRITQTGFIAQEVEAAAKKVNYDFNGVNVPKTSQELYSVSYAEFVVPLVKAVQELESKNNELELQNAALKTQNAIIEKRLKLIEEKLLK